MNKKFKSIIAILLSMVLIFSCIPMSMFAFAASDSNTYVIELPANDTTFEEGTPSSNWIKRDTANYTVAEEGHAGSSKSLYITTTDSSAARLYYKFKVRKDTEYTVRFYAKGSLTNGLQAALVPSEIASGTTVANAKFANTETVTHTLNGEAWQEFALVLPAQDTSSTASIDCYLYFHVNNKNNVKFYVDNLKVAKEAEMTATADANGTATVTNQFGGSTILYGDTVTFTATPDAGYTFDGWYDGDEKVSSDAEYAFSVNEEVNLTAKFKVPEAPNIIELPASDTTFEDGTPSSKWIKKDNAEYAVADGGHAGSSKSLHITSKSSGSAARLYYKFTVRKDTAYTIRFYAKGSLHSDNKLNTALLDHQISSGTVADNKIANTATLEQVLSTDAWREYTLVLPVQDADSTATMDCYLYLHVNNKTNTNVYFDNLTIAKAVEVTATADANGTATVTNQFGGSTILYGDTVTFTATPDAGYAFDGWYDGDVLVSSNVAYTIDDITDSVSLVAKFLDRPINIATIVNSDFESEELDGWSINSNTTGTIVNTESHSGSNSLNLSFEGTGYKHTYLSLNVNANKEYKIRFYAKSNTASPCYLQVLHTSKYTDASNGGVVFINPFAVGNSAAWNEYYLTIPSDNPSEKIYLDFYSNNTSFDVYIDDITVAVEKNITVSTDISSDTNKGYVTFANQYGEVSETQDAVYLYGDTVTAIAHPDSANKLLGWKLSGANEYLSTEESYSFVLEEDTNLVAEFGFDGLGDIDGDNRLTAADLTLMRKMLLDIDIGTGYIIENRDSNGDGEFDIRDLVSLKKKIVDIDGSEGFYSYNELSGQNGYIKQLSYVNNVYADTSKVGELIELKAHINGITSDLNVFDADDVDHGVDLSITLTKGNKTITMPAFYYKGYDVDENNVVTKANGQNEFRFRFTLPESGEWDFVVTLKLKGVQVDTISNTIIAKENSEDKGYIKVSTTDSSRFAYEDGTLYTPIGQNIAYSTVNSKERGADIIGKMTNIADNGANFVRTWLNPWFLSLQKANKNPNDLSSGMADAIQLDAIFEKATELGVNIQLTLFTHTMFKDSDSSTESGWKDSPYKNIISSPEAFFTDDNAEGQTKDYLRYLVARYGYSQNLFAWELMNEADATTNYNEDAVDAWNTKMASYLKDIDPYKHMVTSSNSQMADASNNEEFNFVSLHYYHSEKGAFDFWDPDYVSSVVNQVEANKLGKPVLFGELGFTENDEVYVDADIMRRQLWVSLMSSAGSGASWLWDNIDVNADISQKYFAVEKFAKLIDFESTEYFNAGLSSIKTYNIIGYKGSDSAYLWMYRESGSNSGTLSYTVNNLSNGTYNISFFDTNSGNVISINSATVTNGNLSITTENFTSDIAVIIEKQ